MPLESDNWILVSTLAIIPTVGVVLPWIWQWLSRRSRVTEDPDTIPTAPGAIPLLGHALSYKKDPAGFLRSCQKTAGPLFRLNLAGQRMILVTDRTFAATVARQPDSVLSLRQAVEEYGFCDTLGRDSVYMGTEFHRRVIRHDLVPHHFAAWKQSIRTAMEQALDKEIAGCDVIPDLIESTRRVFVRVVLQSMAGMDVRFITSDLVQDILDWQEKVEDATAAAAVLPSFLASSTVLRSTRRCRLALQAKFVHMLNQQAQAKLTTKPEQWLHVMERDNIELEQRAEFILGLLFVGAKNPALGASQTICFLLQSPEWLSQVTTESSNWLTRGVTGEEKENLAVSCPLGVACIREATRLTALAIGSIRKVKKPVTLATPKDETLVLRAGETVATSLLLPNTDPREWPQAHEFRPSRFLEAPSSDTPSLLTFSQGTHHCPGERLAMVLMHTYVSLLLCKGRVRSEGPIPPLSWERATIAQRQGPVRVSIEWHNPSA